MRNPEKNISLGKRRHRWEDNIKMGLKEIVCEGVDWTDLTQDRDRWWTAVIVTPWSRVLPEKLKRPQLLKKFPAFYGTQRFITEFTRARHLSLS
jgi:hypothetical protein